MATKRNHINSIEAHQLKLMKSHQDWGEDEKVLAVSLKSLYEVATCARVCSGSGHRIERLTGRAYNLGAGALALIKIGLYDESLCLVRQMGEIVNLLSLFSMDARRFKDWCFSTRKERLKKFSPFAIRKAIESREGFPAPLDAEWYQALCEEAVHVTPETNPNAHNKDEVAMIGGCIQSEGRRIAIEHLSIISNFVAMFSTYLTGNNELNEIVVGLSAEQELHR